MGDGSIGEIDLPTASELTVLDRGNLGNLLATPESGTTALDLAFASLTGSIMGLDNIDQLTASDWLGTSASEEVAAEKGIGSLSAYGVGATVLADERFDAGDVALTVNVGDGGVTGAINAGNVQNAIIAGDVTTFTAQCLLGTFDPPKTNTLSVGGMKQSSKIEAKDGVINQVLLTGPGRVYEGKNIWVENLNNLEVKGSLKLTGPIGGSILRLAATGNVQANEVDMGGTFGSISGVSVGGDLTVTDRIQVSVGQASFFVRGTMYAKNGMRIVGSQRTTIPLLYVGKDLSSAIDGNRSNIVLIWVGGKFTQPGAAPNRELLRAMNIGYVIAGQIGDPTSPVIQRIIASGSQPGARPPVEVNLLGVIATTGSVAVEVNAWNGNIGLVKAATSVRQQVKAEYGNIGSVEAPSIMGNIIALAAIDTDGFTKSSGGSIGSVVAAHDLPSLIRAENFLGFVHLTSTLTERPKARPVKIIARGNEKGVNNIVPVVVQYDQAAFTGQVILTYAVGEDPTDLNVGNGGNWLMSFANKNNILQITQVVGGATTKTSYTVDTKSTDTALLQQLTVTGLNGTLTPGKNTTFTDSTGTKLANWDVKGQ